MTSATGPGLPADDTIRRLRAWPSASWGHGERVAIARAALRRLAELAGQARDRPPPVVPELAVTALPDQLLVLLRDAEHAGVAPQALTAVMTALATDLRLV